MEGYIRRVRLVAGALVTLGSLFAWADDAQTDFKRLYEEQRLRSDNLERRLSVLESASTQDVYVAKDLLPESTLSFLQQTEISGFVSASYIHNLNDPESGENGGRGFGTRHDEFMLNKAALFLDKPVEYDAFEWRSGYSVKCYAGQDAPFTQTDLTLGENGDLFEACVALNAPLGNGVKLAAGKLGTPMGYEASFTEENYNWSGGLQWTFVEPFTHTGLKSSYAFSPEWEVELYVFNGWDVVQDNNDAKSYMGHVTYTPREATTLSLIGYGGPEQDDNTSNWRRGTDVYLQQKLTPVITGVAQLDWGAEDGASADGGDASWWGGGLWVIFEPSERWNVALRGDYLDDSDGARTSDAFAPAPDPEAAGTDPNPDSNVSAMDEASPYGGTRLYSLTLTVNAKPVKDVRIAPELRWDHSTSADVFDGKRDQVTLGVGAAYFF